ARDGGGCNSPTPTVSAHSLCQEGTHGCCSTTVRGPRRKQSRKRQRRFFRRCRFRLSASASLDYFSRTAKQCLSKSVTAPKASPKIRHALDFVVAIATASFDNNFVVPGVTVTHHAQHATVRVFTS